jgi:CheY-like chemotaxis protein
MDIKPNSKHRQLCRHSQSPAGVSILERVNAMPGKVLIIDDDDDVVMTMRLPLEAHGYQVFSAAGRQDGLQKVKDIIPDIILLDVMMDSMTAGFEVCRTLRNADISSEYAAYREIPIVMISSIHSTASLRFASGHAGLPVDAFIEKPVQPELLLSSVREHIGKQKSRQGC